MTPKAPSSAQEQIEYLATKVMGWKMHPRIGVFGQPRVYTDRKVFQPEDWNPLTDWNHWRQVEEKVMEDEKLYRYYCFEVSKSTGGAGAFAVDRAIAADLDTRCDALIAAHQELYGSKN